MNEMKKKYFYFHIRRLIERFLKRLGLFLGVLLLLIGLAWGSGRMLLNGQGLLKIQTAIVMENGDSFGRGALDIISAMDSMKSICESSFMNRDEAYLALKEGKISCIIDIPEGLYEDVYQGKESQIEIVMKQGKGYSTKFFRELLFCGIEMVRLSQANVYAAVEIVGEQQENLQNEVGLSVAKEFMQESFDRSALFDRLVLYELGPEKLREFYGCSIAIFFILLQSLLLLPETREMDGAFGERLYQKGITIRLQTYSNLLTCSLLFMLVMLLPMLVVLQYGHYGRAIGWYIGIAMFCGCLAADGIVILLVRIFSENGIIRLLLCSIHGAGLAWSGILLPEWLLDERMQIWKHILPYRAFHNYLEKILQGKSGIGGSLVLLVIGILLTELSIGIGCYRGLGDK